MALVEDRRNRTVAAISSGWVNRRPRGILEAILSCSRLGSEDRCNHVWYCGVMTYAGTTTLTRMPYLDNSSAHSVVSPRMAPFAAAYPEVPPCPVIATLDPMFTIEPRDAIKNGKAAFAIA